MFQIRLTEGTSVTVEVDDGRTWITFPNHKLGLKPAELLQLKAHLEQLDRLRPMLLWINALKSGKYYQTKRRLCRDNAYCCLGVLCEVAIQHGVNTNKVEMPLQKPYGLVGAEYDGHLSILPSIVKQWLNVSISSNQLIEMNDSQDKTFDEIADYLLATYVLPRFPQ